MPNVIKYSESTQTQALKSGNFYLGVGDVGKGPTESSGYWNGVSPPVSGYTVYLNKESGGPSIYTPTNDSELIELTNQIGGTSFTSVTECFNWYNTQSDKMVVNKDYPAIVTDGLVLNLDASFRPSYSGSGTTWYDVAISGKTGLLYNSPVFDNNGWIAFDGTDDISYGWSNTLPTPTTECGLEMMVNIITPSFWGQLFYIGVSSFNHNIPYVAFYTYNSPSLLIFGTNKQSGGSRGVHAVNLSLTGYTNKWIHIFGKMSNGVLSMFLNGNQVGTYNLPNGYFTELGNQNVFIGGGLSTGFVSDVNCYVNYARVYNRALSQQEIKQNFYGGNIVTNGLVLYLDAGNLVSYPQSGTSWYDISSSGNNGTLVNGPTFNSLYGGSIVFDGADDYVNIGDIIFQSGITNNVTIDIWISFPSMTVNDYFMSKGSAGDGAAYTFIGITGGGSSGSLSSYIRFSMSNGTSTSTAIEYSRLIFNQIYNFTFTFNGTQVVGYKNAATPITRTLIGPLYYSTTPIYLGRSKYGTYGNIDIQSFKIYNRTLTEEEVLQNFNAQRYRFGL